MCVWGGGGGLNISDSKYFTEISWDQRILFVKICKQCVNQLSQVIVMCSKLVACCCFPKPCHCCGGILFARVQPKVLHWFMHPTSSTWHVTSVSWLSLPVPCLIVFKIQSCHHLFITLPSPAVSVLHLFMTKVILCWRTVEKMPQKSELNVPLIHLCKPVWGGEQTIWENNVAKIKCYNFDHFLLGKWPNLKILKSLPFSMPGICACVHIWNKRTHLTLVPRSWIQKEGSVNTWQQCFNPHKSITKPLLRGRYQLQGKLSQAEWVSEPEYH